MTVTILMAVGPGKGARYDTPLQKALDEIGINATLVQEAAAETVDYILYTPSAPLRDFTPFTRCKAVLSLWAGIERIVGNITLTQPLCRMVDPALTEGMAEWVTGHVLRHHLGMDRHIVNPEHIWQPITPPLARERQVAMLGIGALGAACARALQALNFRVEGWSRTPKELLGIPCHHGISGLRTVLAKADIVVTLLPSTAETENFLNAETLDWLKPGAVILNPGRGTLIDDMALLAALDSGQVSHATLDVFRMEPLPQDHPFWLHPQITITPHIAADSRPDTASQIIAENIRRGEGREPFLYLVDRKRGY